MCLSVCRKKGFAYAGLQWQIECYCGEEPKSGFEWAWMDKCNNNCAGNSVQICGGLNAISIYSTPPAFLDGFCIHDNPTNPVLGRVEFIASL